MNEPAIKPVEPSQDANALLEELKDENYDTVIVMGFKNGNVYTKSSQPEDWVMLVGALEVAKLDLWNADSGD